MSTLIRFLGLDPGLSSTGFALADVDLAAREISGVIKVGVIKTVPQTSKDVRKTSDQLRRARIPAGALRSLINQHGASIIAMEMSTTTPYTHPTFSFGVMIGIAASLDLPLIEVLPHEVKKAATGDVRGTKAEIIAWAVRKSRRRNVGWPTSPIPNRLQIQLGGKYVTLAAEHPADALAAIQAALATEQFKLSASVLASSDAGGH